MADGSPIAFTQSTIGLLADYAALYAICFPQATHLGGSYLRWLYQANPAGMLLGADAWSDDTLVGQVAAIPGEYTLEGRSVKGLLAVNVVVHPKFQGRHLFKKLGLKLCEYGAEAGYEFIIGVANAVATPGWTRQMGFQLVRPLEARVGVGNPAIDMAAATRLAQFGKDWSEATLKWRLANPNNPVSCRKTRSRLQCYAPAKGKLLPAYAELPGELMLRSEDLPSALLSPFRLFLGLVPKGACKFRTYVDIPQRFRPSPLNFIHRSLTGRVEKLDANTLSFSFLDFDAY